MDGRKQIFTIISPINIDSELKQNLIITKINSIIHFINNNRCRQQGDDDNNYRQQYPLATRTGDVEMREKLAMDLCHPDNIKGMIEQLDLSLQLKSGNERQGRLNFSLILAQFNESTLFNGVTFAHLTAAELAIVGMTIDILLILLHQVRCALQSDDALHEITNKQNEILRIRENVIRCMSYHHAVFNENSKQQGKKDFYYSDILLNLIDAIETIAEVNLVKEKSSLWPDTSYLHVLPDLRLAKQGGPQLVKDYFTEYIESAPPGIQDTHRLADEIKSELDLLEEQEEPKQRVMEPELTASWGCLPWSFWSRPVAKMSVEVDSLLFEGSLLDANSDSASLTASDTTVDDVIRLLDIFNEKAEKQLVKFEIEDELRREINFLRQTLEQEISELMEPSCFAFFRTGTLNKKIAKKYALDNVIGASTLSELGQRANDELNGNDKGLVRAGWHSRTETLLNRIVNVVRIECDDYDTFEFTSASDFALL